MTTGRIAPRKLRLVPHQGGALPPPPVEIVDGFAVDFLCARFGPNRPTSLVKAQAKILKRADGTWATEVARFGELAEARIFGVDEPLEAVWDWLRSQVFAGETTEALTDDSKVASHH
jgi:hypothetical protein